VSEGKADRSVAPRQGSRPSRAKETKDRNITPPAAKRRADKKPKKGERVIDAQLAADPKHVKDAVREHVEAARPDEEPAEVVDPWWTDEREKAFQMVLQGLPQHQIARELTRERHTIKRWLEDDRFETRLYDENVQRFKASRQRRTFQTVRLTDKAHDLAMTMMEEAKDKPRDLSARLAARDWLQEFRENSRREDEIYGLDKQRVDVNVSGSVQHQHRGKVDVGFKAFLTGAMARLGVDVANETIDAERADAALVAIAERAIQGEFLDELVEREKEEQLQLAAARNDR
jgi:hypothetical protein